jgi:hypothetical protein
MHLSSSKYVPNFPSPLSILDLVSLTPYDQWYKYWSSILCSLLQCCVTSSYLGPNIFLSTPHLKTEPSFFPKCGSTSFTIRFRNSIKIQLLKKKKKQSNPWPTISTITAKTCLLLRHTVAKERSINSVDHRSKQFAVQQFPVHLVAHQWEVSWR